jgi:hypothetical protein
MREGDPGPLRGFLLQLALKADGNPIELGELVHEKIYYPKWVTDKPIFRLAEEALLYCPWNEVYDAAEHIYTYLTRNHGKPDQFERELNEFFYREGIGWHMVDGLIEVRGPEALEATIKQGVTALKESNCPTSQNELHEALRALSRRPEPDITGAVQHAGAALECIAREVTGDVNKTLGDIIKRNPNLFPKPLDVGAEKFWGYVSGYGRHLKEGHPPTMEEALLITGLAASLCTYLASKK